jgi:hypothetical protein
VRRVVHILVHRSLILVPGCWSSQRTLSVNGPLICTTPTPPLAMLLSVFQLVFGVFGPFVSAISARPPQPPPELRLPRPPHRLGRRRHRQLLLVQTRHAVVKNGAAGKWIHFRSSADNATGEALKLPSPNETNCNDYHFP